MSNNITNNIIIADNGSERHNKNRENLEQKKN
jgi:hypothetical protein